MFITLTSALTLGILASLSTCAALVGSIVLSLSKNWGKSKVSSSLIFNVGRFLSFGLVGVLLGSLGQSISLSPVVSAWLAIVIAILMVGLGLQMIGFRAFRRFQPPVFRKVVGIVTDSRKGQGQKMTFVIGFLTILLPCGFTLAAEALALASRSASTGLLIMFAFALGTLPILMTIGLTGGVITSKPMLSKIAGVLIVFASLWTVKNSLGVLGFTVSAVPKSSAVLSESSNSQQIIKMTVVSSGYTPNVFTVKTGAPVRWEINSTAPFTCGNFLIVPSLNISRNLKKGENVIEFTPTKAGPINFSCGMEMYRGVINVTD